MEPVGTYCSSSERNFHSSVEPFDLTIGLWMIWGHLGHRNSKFSANSSPNGGYELAPSIWSQSGRNTAPWNPGWNKSMHIGLSSYWRQRNYFWPPCTPINHCKQVRVTMTWRKRSHNVNMNVQKPSSWNRDLRNTRFHMGTNLALLTLQTGSRPGTYFTWHLRPDKTWGYHSSGTSYYKVSCGVKQVEQSLSERKRN